jgi:hypothetical protein
MCRLAERGAKSTREGAKSGVGRHERMKRGSGMETREERSKGIEIRIDEDFTIIKPTVPFKFAKPDQTDKYIIHTSSSVHD